MNSVDRHSSGGSTRDAGHLISGEGQEGGNDEGDASYGDGGELQDEALPAAGPIDNKNSPPIPR